MSIKNKFPGSAGWPLYGFFISFVVVISGVVFGFVGQSLNRESISVIAYLISAGGVLAGMIFVVIGIVQNSIAIYKKITSFMKNND